ncbi:choice-of-anchor D domain-containing protein [Solicola gregarius]|uniref:Choice-of-anchor D domain-containing protein n=1 Tax=Solicola gregarius TaxID=2908642 RepID=A0AA46YJ78_9ACTN|nr:choice-of-anchor D domain-containing protein [Solicola gregarius]UYM04017.1 choice-of-anchor D domain-containing protein [Solicola gregarius]
MRSTPSSRRIHGRFLHVLLGLALLLGLTAITPAYASASASHARQVGESALARPDAKSVATCAKKGAYLAQYYRGRHLKGKPVKARCEKRVDATYPRGKGPKGVNVGPNNFSVKWTTIDHTKARRYDFRAVADNWISIRVDGKQVDGTHQAGRYVSGVRSLRKGKHTVQFRYTKLGGAGYVRGEYVRAPDKKAPRTPRSLRAKAGDSSVALRWKGSNEIDLRGYLVYHGSKKLAEVKGTRFTDTKAENGKDYTYRVRSIDYRGNQSGRSNADTATPKDETAPAMPQGLAAVEGDGKVDLSWEEDSGSDVEKYLIYRDDIEIDTVTGGQTSYLDADVVNGTTYRYEIVAVDEAGNPSERSAPKDATPEDRTAPQIPDGLTANEANDAVVLDWNDNPDDTVHYDVYRADNANVDTTGTPISPEDLAESTFTDTDVEVDSMYYYRVVAVDGNGNRSEPSEIASITVGDQEAPLAPTELAATAGDGQVDLEWAASASDDVAGYRIYRATTPTVDIAPANLIDGLGNVAEYSDQDVENDTTYYYAVVTVDQAGNASPSSEIASATPTDTTAPGAPAGLAATGGDGLVELAWDASADSDVTGYRVYRGDTADVATGVGATPISGDTPLATLAYTDTDVDNDSTYFYVVVAVDGHGNVSAASDAASATPSDTTPPGAPTGLVATPGDGEVALDWDDSADADFDHFAVYRTTDVNALVDDDPIAEPETSEYADTDVENGTTYHYTVVAVDTHGNTSPESDSVDATPVDESAPALPSGLSATASASAIDLAWDENGESDLAGYNVFRAEVPEVPTDGDPLNDGLLTEPAFSDDAASTGTQYFYVVVAVDDDGNVSAPSEAADATIAAPEPVHEKYSFTTTADTAVPAGYTKNDGSAWTDPAGIGWVTEASLDAEEHEPLDLTKNTRVRNARQGVSELQRRLIHMHYGDVETPDTTTTQTAGAFERSVPDGWYQVKVSVGDQPGGPGYDSQHTINVEGETAIDGFQGSAAKEFETGTATVEVTDGRLTVDAIGGTNTKLNYLELDATDEPDTEAPAAPTGVSATAGDAQIDVTWDESGEEDLAGYNVYRGESADVSTDGDPMNTELLTALSFRDDTAEPGTEYFYVVTALDDSGNESDASEPSAGATVPAGAEVHDKFSFTTSADTDVPDGYTKNDGSPWTDAAGLGWVEEESLDSADHTPLDLTRNTRIRPRASIGALQNRLIHLHYGDIVPASTNGEPTPGAFELAVPDGWYEVKASVGDQPGGAKAGCPEPCYDSVHRVNVEGQTAISDFQATADSEFKIGTTIVEVTDGRLTVDSIGGNNTKLNYLEVDSTDEPAEPDVHQKVRFADQASTPPAGYLKDFGQAYGERTGEDQGAGLSYGWLELGTDDPVSLVGNGRNRLTDPTPPPSGTPELRAGLMHMQLPENATNGVDTPGDWAMAVPDGTYDVEVSVGDAGTAVDSEHWLNLEGQNAIAAFVPTGGAGSATHHTTAERTVTVSDGELTVSPEGGTNTKINWVTIDSVPGSSDRPSVRATTPANLATDVDPKSTSVVSDLDLVDGGVEPDTLDGGTVTLTKVADDSAMDGTAYTSGGADTIGFAPAAELEADTLYRFEVTDGVEDVDGNAFLPYSMVFETGTSETGGGPVAFDKSDSGAPRGAQYTSVVKGPDGKLYAGSITGEIYRFDIESDGTLANRQTINTVKNYSNAAASGDTYQKGTRSVIGLAFDPSSTADNLILWISDNAPYLGASNVPDSSGRIAKLTGTNLENYTAVLEHLPRSVKDHETNSLAFGPDGALYFNQGANNAMGAPDGAWANRSERLLSAAVLRLDTSKLPSDLPLDVGTGDAGDYDPFATSAPLTIYGHGVRNAYDLVWHSNGHLYVPTNGSAAGGNVPTVPDPLPAVCAQRPDGGYTGPKVAGVDNNPAETDYVFDIKKGQYYGHPNPSRCEYVLNNGNPTAGADPFENSKYPVGTQPDPNYALSDVYDAGSHASANGVIEYEGGAFGGALDGKLLYVRYSDGQDIVTFDVGANGKLTNRTVGRTGLTGFNQPLDLTEDVTTGNLYVTELSGNSGIVLLKPQGGGGGPVGNATDRLVFSGPTGSTSDPLDAVVDNDGSDDLVVTGATLGGANANQFALGSSTFPQTVEPGASLDLAVTFKPTSVGVKSANLVLATNAGPKTVRLRGLAAAGLGGGNEPSLQRVMDTLEIPVDVGDPDPSNAAMPSTQGMIGDEVPAQLFKKAAFDTPITVTPVAAYGPQNDDPAIHVGWYEASSASGLHEQFDVAAGDAQGLMIDPDGTTTGIDPGEDASFGFYSEWPYFDGRKAYTEDALNTWDSTLPHHVRVYPYKNSDGTVEPDTYVVATEEVPGSNFDGQDIVLVVTNVEPYVPEASDAVLKTTNLDGVPYDDRLAFSRIQSPADGNQKTHDVSTVRISNTGTESMQVTDLNVVGNFEIADAPGVPFDIPAGGHEDVSVRFTATGGNVHTGSLTINSNAGTNGVESVALAGFWQSQSEGGQEPSVAEMAQVFGYTTTIPTNLNGDGLVQAVGDEVLSPYWRRANTGAPVRVRQLAAYHTYGNGASFQWTEQSGARHGVTNFDTPYSQSILPPRSGGWPVSFTPGQAVFGFAVDGESSDDTKNNQSADEANGCPGPCGHHVRIFPVKDREGDVVPNSYLLTMDYSGINYDYNDNVYLIENITPTKLPTPKGVSALAEDGKVTLTWSPIDQEGVGYRVWRSTTPDVPVDDAHRVSGTDPLTESELVDEDVTNGTTYYYVVRAVVQGVSNSDSTQPVAATPNDAGAFVEKVNFQNQSAPLPAGYLKDFGQSYGARTGADQGSGLSYGWITEDGGQPVDLSVGGTTGPGNGRDRNAEDDQRLDTLMHMQGDDVPDFNGTPIAGKWEVAVPDGTYAVTVAVGDPNNNTDPEIHTINVEGTNAISGFVPSGSAGSASHHETATVEVEVEDGRLTVDALGGTNTKVNYVDIAATN